MDLTPHFFAPRDIVLPGLAGVFVAAFLFSRLFKNPRTRRWIVWGAVGPYVVLFVAFVAFMDFALSGNMQ